MKTGIVELKLAPEDNRRLANLCGPLDENLRQIEAAFDVTIGRRGMSFRVIGDAAAPRQAPFAFYEGRHVGLAI